jgi:Flp pilus assembly protein TadG
MSGRRTNSRSGEQGQALVILTVSLAALLAMVALLVDGGNAMAQHRGTQNAVDAGALAGGTVMVQNVGDPGSKTGSDVLAAINATLADNRASLTTAQYVRLDLSVIGPVTDGPIPLDAAGVSVSGVRQFNTLIAGFAGRSNATVGAEATALAGPLVGACIGCVILPVTFPVQITTCDGTNRSVTIGPDGSENPYWVEVPYEIALADRGVGVWEAIVPLCTNGPGNVGWLNFREFGCTGPIANWIMPPPCEVELTVPGWFDAETGNRNNLEAALNAHAGDIVMIPLHDARRGVGTNLEYHVPKIVAFMIDRAYVQGNNHQQCNQDPGYPYVGGNGSTGCLKGWFIDLVSLGQVGDMSGQGGSPSVLGVQLVH